MRVMHRGTNEAGTVQTIWDLTDDVRREEELQAAHASAQAASSAKSDFLSSMSHELRTPLNAILGFAQLMHADRKVPLPDRHRDRVAHILRGGEHLLRLIDEVLDLARIEARGITVSSEHISLLEVLLDVKSTLDPIAEAAEIAVVIEELPAPVRTLLGDRTRFKQILMNFGSNAIKYGRKGGTTRFKVTGDDRWVRVEVMDDGIGIPASKQAKIFQPFQRAGQETSTIEGTGIGLTISRRLAELMGGRVDFESMEGQGSRFWIELPVLDTAPNQPLG